MKIIDQISVFVANTPGRLSDITGILSDNSIDIRALSIADTADFGILRLIVNDPAKAVAALQAGGLTARITEVVAARLDDKPGALHGVLSALTENGISVEYAYAFITRRNDDACVILRVEDNEKAIGALEKSGVAMLSADEVYGF